MLYKLYGFIHKTAKKVLRKSNTVLKQYKMINFEDILFVDGEWSVPASYKGCINEIDVSKCEKIKKCDVYPLENLVEKKCLFLRNTFPGKKTYQDYSSLSTEELWNHFIKQSVIPYGYKYGGCHYGGYIKEQNQWCLPSWIWTNSAIVRYFCRSGQIEKAIELGHNILDYQQECGGWIVRNDYSSDGIIPMLAPNDSAYIANNCCIELYKKTHQKCFLEAAEKNAEWIIKSARPDGLVYLGFDMKKQVWIQDRNIVDTGFTAALFSKLYQETGKHKYKLFLEQFVKRYVEIFYMPAKKCFATAIDIHDRKKGGAFGRGQAWALEGLIPAYEVLKSEWLKQIIYDTITTLLEKQTRSGGWNYNLLNPYMGVDCKATPILAWNFLAWYKLEPHSALIESAEKAINWCEKHTETNGNAAGGIFSYTIEGAVVHHMYSETAFVYSNCYALETKQQLREIKNGR